MPANVVKTKSDEKHWNAAKAQARKQGKSGNWAYVMGIFNNMTGRDKTASLLTQHLNEMQARRFIMLEQAHQGMELRASITSTVGRATERAIEQAAAASTEGTIRGVTAGITGALKGIKNSVVDHPKEAGIVLGGAILLGLISQGAFKPAPPKPESYPDIRATDYIPKTGALGIGAVAALLGGGIGLGHFGVPALERYMAKKKMEHQLEKAMAAQAMASASR